MTRQMERDQLATLGLYVRNLKEVEDLPLPEPDSIYYGFSVALKNEISKNYRAAIEVLSRTGRATEA